MSSFSNYRTNLSEFIFIKKKNFSTLQRHTMIKKAKIEYFNQILKLRCSCQSFIVCINLGKSLSAINLEIHSKSNIMRIIVELSLNKKFLQ